MKKNPPSLPPAPLPPAQATPPVLPIGTPKARAAQTSVALPQHNASWAHWAGAILLVLFLSVGFKGCVSAINESGKDKYPAAEYEAWLQVANEAVAAKGLVYKRDFMIEFGGGGDHQMLRITLNTTGAASPREYKDCADSLAEAYCSKFPNDKQVYVIVKDYQQMKTVYEELYSW